MLFRSPAQDNGETLWPQVASIDGATYILYSPQFESLIGSSASARSAFRVKRAGEPAKFGAVHFSASIDNDPASGLVLVSDLLVQKVGFADGSDSTALTAVLQKMMSGVTFSVQRAAALANMNATNAALAGPTELNNRPPAIRTVDHAAVLLLLDGAPVLRDVGAGVGIAQNTPSLLALDTGSNTWYVRVGTGTWLHSSRYTGPFIAGNAPGDAARRAIDATRACAYCT